MFHKLAGVRLKAVRAAVPEREIRIEDELEYYGGSLKKAQRAKKIIGVDKRRIAYPGIRASDLCQAAAENLLRTGEIDPKSVDGLIMVTQSPDFDLPATACRLHGELGLSTDCVAFDVNQGCAGFVYGLWLASCIISSGARKRVLVMAGDATAKPRPVENRIIAPIFGDGGSAAILEKAEEASLSFELGTEGAGYRNIIVPAGRAELDYMREGDVNSFIFEDIVDESGTPWRLNEVFMNGGAIFDFTLNVVPDHIGKVLAESGLTKDEIDWLFLHQANKQIVETIADKTGFPREKAPSASFSAYGNLSSASIPAAMCEQFGETGSSGSANLLLCGYGVGLSWASCLLLGQDVSCAPVISIPNQPGRWEKAREEWTEYLKSGGRRCK